MRYPILLAVCLAACSDPSPEVADTSEPDTAVIPDDVMEEPDVVEPEDPGPPVLDISDLTVSFGAPKDGDTVSGLVQISVFADSVNGVTSLTVTEPAGLIDQDSSTEAFKAGWDSSAVEDGEITIVATAVAGNGEERTESLTVTVQNNGAGLLRGRASLHEALEGATVSVSLYDGFTVGTPLGSATTDAQGKFEVPLSAPSPGARVVVVVSGSLTATAVLAGGEADVVVTGLTSLAFELGSYLRVQGRTGEAAFAEADKRLNDHITRPAETDSVHAWPLPADLADGTTLSALVHWGVFELAKASGDTPETIWDLLKKDIGDGLLDGKIGGDALTSPKGWQPTSYTTRKDLAAAVWAAANGSLPAALDTSAISAEGGILDDLSLDAGPLYPPGDAPEAFTP